MAEPGDPQTHHDHDDLIGFTSPASLTGAERRAAPEPEAEPETSEAPPVAPFEASAAVDDGAGADEAYAADRDLFDPSPLAPVVAAPEPEPEPIPEAALDSDDLGPLFGRPSPTAVARSEPVAPPARPLAANQDFDAPPSPRPADPRPVPAAGALPAWALETVRPTKPSPEATFGRAKGVEPPQGAMGLYSVYALILFAVPTLGVSAFIALFAVTTRTRPEQPLARSHFDFQKRTLWIAAVGAVLGVVLIAVNLGVFVLFLMAVWVLIRGAAGLVRLASGRPIANPKTLLL